MTAREPRAWRYLLGDNLVGVRLKSRFDRVFLGLSMREGSLCATQINSKEITRLKDAVLVVEYWES